MVFKNTEVARFITSIDKTSPSIFMLPHPLQGTRSMCSIGSSTNSCAPLFDTLSLDAHLLELAVMLRETKQEGLAYFKTFSWTAPPAHQMAHLQERADTILRCVRSSRSGCTFVCLCSTADRTLLTLGRPLPRRTWGGSRPFSVSVVVSTGVVDPR